MDSFIDGFLYGYSQIKDFIILVELMAIGLIAYAIFIRYNKK